MNPEDRRLLDEQVAYYRARAAEYAATSMPAGDPFANHARTIRRSLRDLDLRGRVLEIAAGTGQWTELLAERADELVVTDSAPEMLEIVRSRLDGTPGIRFELADAFTLEASHAYDAAFFGFFLSHVPTGLLEAFWAVMDGVLAPGGRVVFVDEGRHFEWREDWIEPNAGIVLRPLLDGSVHRAVKVHWDSAQLEARLADLGWDASVQSEGPLYWGVASRR